MRLIDADALKRNLIKDHLIDSDLPYFSAIEAIDNAPTVEDRPQGEWIEWTDERFGGVTIYCSECNKDALCKYEDGVFRQMKSDYCPNCGAKMEAENDES